MATEIYPPYDEILSRGRIRTEVKCARNEYDSHVGYTSPNIKRATLLAMIASDKKWMEKFRVSRCDEIGGCQEDCQFRQYLNTPTETIANVFLGSNALAQPSLIRRLLMRFSR